MILGAGTISNYGSYISNCTLNQMPYKIPVNALSDVQLYIAIGVTKPDAVQYQLIHTCGGGGIETITPGSYVVGQDSADVWYGVFKNFSGSTPTCFVIAITLSFGFGDRIYFSEEYCIDSNCGSELTLIQGCYGNLNTLISYDCNGIYFGVHSGTAEAMGSETVVYKHQLFLRGIEVNLTAIKNTFKQGRTRNFRTEKEKLYEFLSEVVPEWYMTEVDAVFNRGEVFVGSTKYLVNDTNFANVEACKKIWKLAANFKESCYQSFSCELDPCADPEPPVIEPCCDPEIISATSTFALCCDPEVTSATSEVI